MLWIGKKGVGVAVASGGIVASATPSFVACCRLTGSATASEIALTVSSAGMALINAGEIQLMMSVGIRNIQSNRFCKVIMV